MRQSRARTTWLWGAAAAVVFLLAACSWLPLPADVDLKTRLGPQADGSFQEELSGHELEDFDIRYPRDAGACVEFAEVEPGVTVQSARVHYDIDMAYAGPRLSGTVRAQLFAAGSTGEVWTASNQVGPTVTLNLDQANTRLAGSAVLNPRQLDAVNERRVCWGLQVSGRDVGAAEGGTGTISYEVNQLLLKIRFSVL